MKAAFIRKTGGPDVIEWGDVPAPTIKDDDVLVKVKAVAVNPVDTYFRSGKCSIGHPSDPYIIGLDMVGVVAQVGARVKELKQCADIVGCCLAEHRLKAKIANELPLSKAAEAHSLLEVKGGIWGKIVLKVS